MRAAAPLLSVEHVCACARPDYELCVPAGAPRLQFCLCPCSAARSFRLLSVSSLMRTQSRLALPYACHMQSYRSFSVYTSHRYGGSPVILSYAWSPHANTEWAS